MLSSLYPEFSKYFNEENSYPHFDFKDPDSMKALSWALLKHDFNLEVDFPLDRLIPTIPLRMNYILWIEDILKSQNDVTGIDIGCGASCIYPLLGCKNCNWSFIATEFDTLNFEYARKNVNNNNMNDHITVVKVDENYSLLDIVRNHPKKYTFTMCNPPFYSNNLEAWCGKSRKDNRPEPHSISTASPQESICPGGEINYVKSMIDDSLELKTEILFYTSMLGKKSSVSILKEYLKSKNIVNVGVTEFCQGRTMRWGLGWSFYEKINFGKLPSKAAKCKVSNKALRYCLPQKCELLPDLQYNVQSMGRKITSYLDDLKIRYEPIESSTDKIKLQMVAVENTWSHQRKKRRLLLNDNGIKRKKTEVESSDSKFYDDLTLNQKNNSFAVPEMKDENINGYGADDNGENDLNLEIDIDDIVNYVLKCELSILKDSDDILLLMTWIDGENRESMNQMLQFFKNAIR